MFVLKKKGIFLDIPLNGCSVRRPARRRFFLWAVVVVLLGSGTIFGISAAVGWKLTHRAHRSLEATPASVGLAFEAVHFPSRMGSPVLRGWIMGSGNSNGMVIFAHGYARNRVESDVPLLPLAAELVKAGYAVLTFDFRGCGESGGNMTTLGLYETEDLLGAVNFVRSMPEAKKKIMLFGFSMGASTAIIAGAREPAVAAVIADSPFCDLKSYLEENLSSWTHLPPIPFDRTCLWIVPLLTGLDPEKVSPIREICALGTRPLLIIHGDKDKLVPLRNGEALQDVYPYAKLLRVKGAGHVKSFETDRVLYLKTVTDFLDGVGKSGR